MKYDIYINTKEKNMQGIFIKTLTFYENVIEYYQLNNYEEKEKIYRKFNRELGMVKTSSRIYMGSFGVIIN